MSAAICLTSAVLWNPFFTVLTEQETDIARTISTDSLHLSSTNADRLGRKTSFGLPRM